MVYRDSPSTDFLQFAESNVVEVVARRTDGASSWNCKPHALLPLLEAGREHVVWLDSDVLLARDCRAMLSAIPASTVVACEEYATAPWQGSELRTRGWGFEVGRKFARTLNSAVLRVSRAHTPLLEQWRRLLDDHYYSRWQAKPLHEGPLHCWGDQDVLNALLGAKDFSEIPVEVLRTGVEVAHCSSFTSFSAAERARCLMHGMPSFVHCQGGKPWIHLSDSCFASSSLKERLLHELSAYRLLSKRYAVDVGVECSWMTRTSALGRVFRLLGFGHLALTGLPLALGAQLARRFLRRSEIGLHAGGVRRDDGARMEAT